jgi:putative membrane protein
MVDWLSANYLWLQSLHIIAVIAWMAGMFYLPRLYVYHAMATPASETVETFKVMEDKLLRIIMNPAMIASWVFGLLMLWANPALLGEGWFHGKLLLVVLMTGVHGVYAGWRRQFAADRNTRSDRFYRFANEVPTVLMIAVVILAVVKPLF